MCHVLHVIIYLLYIKDMIIVGNIYYYILYYILCGRFHVLLFESLINLFKHP